jgi:hypothetical protein
MGVSMGTYGAHERAEMPSGRDYGPDEARKYARRFGVTPEWLLIGREPLQSGDELPPPKLSVVGYVGAGAAVHFYDVPLSYLDEITPPTGIDENTAAVESRDDSLGPFLNRWYVFYDDVRGPVTPDHVGQLCVVGLSDGRILSSRCSVAVPRASTPSIPPLTSRWSTCPSSGRRTSTSLHAAAQFDSAPKPGNLRGAKRDSLPPPPLGERRHRGPAV